MVFITLIKIIRASFEKAVSQVEIGLKMAMKRFDAMVKGFRDAINQAKEELKNQGFKPMEQISEMIMKKGAFVGVFDVTNNIDD